MIIMNEMTTQSYNKASLKTIALSRISGYVLDHILLTDEIYGICKYGHGPEVVLIGYEWHAKNFANHPKLALIMHSSTYPYCTLYKTAKRIINIVARNQVAIVLTRWRKSEFIFVPHLYIRQMATHCPQLLPTQLPIPDVPFGRVSITQPNYRYIQIANESISLSDETVDILASFGINDIDQWHDQPVIDMLSEIMRVDFEIQYSKKIARVQRARETIKQLLIMMDRWPKAVVQITTYAQQEMES